MLPVLLFVVFTFQEVTQINMLAALPQVRWDISFISGFIIIIIIFFFLQETLWSRAEKNVFQTVVATWLKKI